MSAQKWYEVTGVFDAATKTITVYVFDPVTGMQVGAPVSQAVTHTALHTYGGASNLFFLEAPANGNGHNTGGQLENAAVWDLALTPAEISRLSQPLQGTLVTIR